jgi:phosphatidylserine/phosphatidylglycerophosphate/cardiolipin synthase-like enzyme
LLREPVGFLARYLEPRQLSRAGIREIPPHPARAPSEEELRRQLDRIEAIIRATGGPRRERADVLGVRSIQRRTRIFQPAVALVYRTRDTKRSQGQVAFVVAGQLSERHAEVFTKAGLAPKLGIARRGLEDGQQLAARQLGGDVAELAKAQAASEPPAASLDSIDVSPASGVRGVETYEHPELIRHALRSASERIVLISPWLKSAVLDEKLLRDFASALERGVELYLGWGIGGDGATGRDADAEALQALGKLAEEHPNFHFRRLGRTHAKVLVCDRNFMVVTSFNWLSFKGDPKRTFRDERGLLVSLPEQIDEQFEELISRFEQ